MPVYLLAGASAAWNAHEVPAPDDFWYARMCPQGVRLYLAEFGLYRILTAGFHIAVNPLVLASSVPLWVLSLMVHVAASGVLALTCAAVGLARQRAVVLFGLLVSCPLLLETTSFWSASAVQALALLFLAGYLYLLPRAREAVGRRRKILTVVFGTALGLAIYEMVVPFVIASSSFFVARTRQRVTLVTGAVVALFGLILALERAGVYNAFRWHVFGSFLARPEFVIAGNIRDWERRVSIYGRVVPDVIATGLADWGVWALLAGLGVFLWRSGWRTGASGGRGRGPLSGEWRLVAACFAFGFLAGTAYLLGGRWATMRHLGLVAIYGYCALAWTRGRIASLAAIAILGLQCAFAAGFPAHFQSAAMAASGQAAARSAGPADVVEVDGRLALFHWSSRALMRRHPEHGLQLLWARRPDYREACGGLPVSSKDKDRDSR